MQKTQRSKLGSHSAASYRRCKPRVSVAPCNCTDASDSSTDHDDGLCNQLFALVALIKCFVAVCATITQNPLLKPHHGMRWHGTSMHTAEQAHKQSWYCLCATEGLCMCMQCQTPDASHVGVSNPLDVHLQAYVGSCQPTLFHKGANCLLLTT